MSLTLLRRTRLAQPKPLAAGKLAERAGVDAGLYSRLELGRASVPPDTAAKIAAELHVPLSEIFEPSRYCAAQHGKKKAVRSVYPQGEAS